MFRNTVECGNVSMRVSEIIVPTGNSLIFPADGPCDMLSTGHAARFRYRRWAASDSDVVYGNTSCGRGFTNLPHASVVAKSEKLEERPIPVEFVVGQCAG